MRTGYTDADMSELPSLHQVVGKNVARLRAEHGVTQAALARAARGFGLRWQDTRVSELENGTLPTPSADTLLLIALAMQDICGSVTLAEFLRGDGKVAIGRGISVTLDSLRHVVAGASIEALRHDLSYAIPHAADMVSADIERDKRILGDPPPPEFYGYNRRGLIAAQSETKALRTLAVPASTLSALAFAAWGRSLSEERDARSPEGATPQKRGRITRELVEELQALLEASDG